METEEGVRPSQNQSKLLYALEAKNSERALQLLKEYKTSSTNVAEQLDEVVDFLDRLDRAEFPETASSEVYKQAVAVLCSLVNAGDPQILRERSAFLLSYLVSSLWLDIPQLASSLWLLWLADRSAAEQALREYGLTSAKPSVKLASVKELENWVDAVKGKIAFRKFTPTIVRLLRDESPDVRQAAYSLLVKYFANAKAPAREDLAGIMKRNQLNDVLKERLFSAIRRAAGETIDMPAQPTPRPASAQPSIRPRPAQLVIPENPICAEGLLSCESDPLYPMQSLDCLKIGSDAEFLARVGDSLSCFDGKETEGNWSSRQVAVQTYRRMLRSEPQPSKQAIRDAFKLLQRKFVEVLLSMRTTLVMDTCQAVKDTLQILSQSLFFSDLFDPLLESLTKVATGVKKITANAAHITLCSLFIESPALSNRQFSAILQESKNLKPHARANAYYWLICSLRTFEATSLAPRQADIEQIMLRAVSDAAPAGRVQGKDLYLTALKTWPELAANVEKKLSPSASRTLLKAMSDSKTSIASPSRPASFERRSPDTPKKTPSPTITKQPSPVLESPSKLISRHSSPLSPRLRTLSRTSSRPASNESSRAQTPEQTSRKFSPTAEPLTQSIADLSMQDVELPDSGSRNTVDFHNKTSILEAAKRNPADVLRQLASANVSPTLAKSVLTTVKSSNPELASSSAVARFIHKDVERSTQSQREGYLNLLRLLDYESVSEVRHTLTPERGIFSPARKTEDKENESTRLFEFPSANFNTVASPMRDQIYVDSESGEDTSNVSLLSSASSFSLSASSQQPGTNAKLARPDYLHPFPLDASECKVEISKMVEAVKMRTCTSETLAKLAVLVTAAASTPNSPTSPLHTAVSIWRQHFTYDMQLRDAILPFVSQEPDKVSLEAVVVGLVVLRALLQCNSVPHAAVYLDAVACLQALCHVSTHFSNQSLELDEKLLPELADIVARNSAKSTSTHAFFDYLGSVIGPAASTTANTSSSKVLCLRAATQATQVCYPQFTSSERQALEQMVTIGIQNNDVRVRKEVYPLLLAIHGCDPELAQSASKVLSGGQKQLYSYYLDAQMQLPT